MKTSEPLRFLGLRIVAILALVLSTPLLILATAWWVLTGHNVLTGRRAEEPEPTTMAMQYDLPDVPSQEPDAPSKRAVLLFWAVVLLALLAIGTLPGFIADLPLSR